MNVRNAEEHGLRRDEHLEPGLLLRLRAELRPDLRAASRDGDAALQPARLQGPHGREQHAEPSLPQAGTRRTFDIRLRGQVSGGVQFRIQRLREFPERKPLRLLPLRIAGLGRIGRRVLAAFGISERHLFQTARLHGVVGNDRSLNDRFLYLSTSQYQCQRGSVRIVADRDRRLQRYRSVPT